MGPGRDLAWSMNIFSGVHFGQYKLMLTLSSISTRKVNMDGFIASSISLK